MKQFKPLFIAMLLATSVSVNAQSDAYYSQGLDIDFSLADENVSLKVALESVIERVIEFIGPISDNSMKVKFDYYSDMERDLDN